MQKIIVILLTFIIAPIISADEYVYPVAQFDRDGQTHIYLLYQKSLRHIELWDWSPVTKQVNKALLSTFTPAGLKLLPDNAGFSFVDSGRIRVKHPDKRSPKALAIYNPIYDISLLEWLDAKRCYFSAKEQDRYSIFQLNMQGDLDRLVAGIGCDCMYPQKQQDTLFYIERCVVDKKQQYRLMAVPYPCVVYDETNNFNNTEHFEERVRDLMEKEEKITPYFCLADARKQTVLLDFGISPRAFLSMVSSTEGFVIGHPREIGKQDAVISFSYYRVIQRAGIWHEELLFTFDVPSHLLLTGSSSCLYESLLPLLPRYCNGMLYFVDCSTSGVNRNLNVFSYHCERKTITQLSSATALNQLFFAPMIVGNKLYFGGTLLQPDEEMPVPFDEQELALPGMCLDEQGIMCFELPSITI